MNRRIIWIVGIAALAIVALAVAPLFRQGSNRTGGPSGLSGTTAPIFDLRDDRGAPATLAQYRGKIVVMNLWASWCPPCRAEMPDLERLARTHPSKLVIVGVNEGESPERAQAFAKSLGITFPIWIDGEQRYGRVYGALGMPTTVIVGSSGTIVRGFDGALTFDQMQAAVTPLLRTQ